MPPLLRSPLLGTALVLACMATLAIPLCHLTAKSKLSTARPAPAASPTSSGSIPGYLRITTVDPLTRLKVLAPDGSILAQFETLDPGEHEIEAVFPWNEETIDLTLVASSGDKTTAIFLTAMPDRYQQRTAYAIGTGQIREELRFEWDHE